MGLASGRSHSALVSARALTRAVCVDCVGVIDAESLAHTHTHSGSISKAMGARSPRRDWLSRI
jgi:hypothetical protein